ncbi:hypothetical protein [Escherichia fergusonii]|nr:hypothetical protein [Escherichia fergusonii]
MTGTIVANDGNFGLDEGFPTTGFIGAWFILSSDMQIEYDKTTCGGNENSCDWLHVNTMSPNSHEVSFIGQPTSETREVTINFISLSDDNIIYTYTFNLTAWFSTISPVQDTRQQAIDRCGGAENLPLLKDLTSATALGQPGIRGIGNLHGEWGNINRILNTSIFNVWTNEIFPPVYYYIVNVSVGIPNMQSENAHINTICRTIL